MSSGQGTLHYHYDGHGELAGVLGPDGTQTLRFYQGYQLSHEVSGGKVNHVLHADDLPLAYSAGDEIAQTRLLLTNAVATVIAEARQSEVVTAAYTAYGESDGTLAFLLGFNAEPQQHGWYMLGRGYRAYSPYLKRFNRPDSESPFGEGGLNPYMYCQGNPVKFHDPSGHIVRETPAYYYPPPPPPPPPKPKKQGGGWMKWLGVAIAAVFMVYSAVTMPWSLGVSAPAMVTAIKGLAIQGAALAMSVVGTVTEDPTLQMVTMIGSMAAGIYGGILTARGAAAGAAIIKEQKAAAAVMGKGLGAPSVTPQAAAPLPNYTKLTPDNSFAAFGPDLKVQKIPRVGQLSNYQPSYLARRTGEWSRTSYTNLGTFIDKGRPTNFSVAPWQTSQWTRTNRFGTRPITA